MKIPIIILSFLLMAFDQKSGVLDTHCPPYDSGSIAGQIPEDLPELSGLSASQTHFTREGPLLWAHNDSGSAWDDWLFLLQPDGLELARYHMGTNRNRDMEDIALSGGLIYIGDIGDNNRQRSEIQIYRNEEPSIVNRNPDNPVEDRKTFASMDRLRMRYPGGLRFDSEALFLFRGNIYIVTKNKSNRQNGIVTIYQNPAPHIPDQLVTLKEITQIDLNGINYPGSNEITGADAQDPWIGIRSYSHLFLYPRFISRRPCVYETNDRSPFGEAIALTGNSFLTASEGSRTPIWRHRK